MEIYRRQIQRGSVRFLVLTDNDLKTGAARAVIVDTRTQTVKRVPDLQKLMRQERWEPILSSDPTLNTLVQSVPALRRYRGIEVRLPTGETAWIRWRQWSSENAAMQELLTKTTRDLVIPAYEPDGDYFLATQAASRLGGEVLDLPRSVLLVPDDAY